MRKAFLFSGVLLMLAGCAPNFEKVGSILDDSAGIEQSRVNPAKNAVLENGTAALDTVLFSRKLNGAIGAEIIGTRQFVIVPTFNRRLYFFDPLTGKEVNNLITTSAVAAAPALRGELLYYAEQSGGDRITCFNLVNGKTVWTARVIDPQGAPTIDGDGLFLASRDGKMFRFNRWNGTKEWEHDSKAQVYSSLAVDSESAFFGTDEGKIICLDKTAGTHRWSFKAGGVIFASPVAERFVYCGSGDGILFALDKATGKEIWNFHAGGQIETTPAIFQDRLVFGADDRKLYCLSPENGALLWSFETSGIIHSSPLLLADRIVCANSAGVIYFLDYDGNLLKSIIVNGSVTAAPTYIADRLFVATHKRYFYCIGPKNQ